jgi:ligand-binding sensor domain-containing protein
VAVHSNLHLRCLLVDRSLLSPLLIFAGVLFLAPALPAYAQADWSVRHFSAADGLAQNYVTSAVQDGEGFMWFATRGGLSRFDGTSFLTFRSDPQTAGTLSSNFVEGLLEDSAGRLWVTTAVGIDMLDATRSSFTSVNPGFRPMIEDAEGALWGLSTDGTLHRAAFEGGRFVPLNLDVHDGRAQFVASGPNDAVWALFNGPKNHVIAVR